MKRVFGSYYFVFFVAAASTQPFLTLYLSGRGLSSEHIGVLLAVGACAGIVAQPLLGYLNDRSDDARRLLILSALVSPIIYMFYALVHAYLLLLCVAMVYAIVQSTGPIADAMAVQSANTNQFTYGEVRLWGALSFAITTMVAGYVYHTTGLSLAFFVYGGLSLCLIVIARLLPKNRKAPQASEMLLHGVWNVAKDKRLMGFIAICFILSTAITINFTYLPLYFKALHYPLAWVGLNFTVAALVEVPLFYVSGILMKKIGAVSVIVIATSLYAMKYFLMGLAPPPGIVILIQVLDGIGYALYWSAGVQIVSELSPKGRNATAQTLFGAIATSFSSIAGSVIGGWLLQSYGPKQLYLVNGFIGAAALIGFIVFARLTSTKQNRIVDNSPTTESNVDSW